MKRLFSTCTAMVVALGLTWSVSPADALDHQAPTAQRARALPERPISIDWDQVRSTTKVKLSGAAQDLVHGVVYLQERRGGHWKRLDKTRTNDASRYHFVTRVPKDGHHHKYRAMTPKGGGYKNSASQIVELYWT